MFEKEYTKNLTKLKNRLQGQSNRPNFLQDQNWTSSEKSQPQIRKSYKPKHENKSSKVFDLDQIKRQLGLIELKNSPTQEIQNSKKVEKVSVLQVPSFKKQKQSVKEDSQKKSIHKSSKIIIKQVSNPNEDTVNQNGGFTQRINELVKLRVQHENIINSLVKKKPSNLPTEEDNIPISLMKNHSHSSGYIKVTNQYEVYSPQKSQNQSKRFQKPKNPPPKLQLDTGTFNYSKNIKNTFTFEKQPDDFKENKTNQKQKVEIKDTSEKDYKRTFTEKQLLKIPKQQIHLRPLTFTEPRIESKKHSKQVSRITQPITQDNEQMQQSNELNELNESKFEMQHHVNLLASLSQFQYTNRQKNQKQVASDYQESQLYQSLLNFIQRSILSNKKFSDLFQNKKPQIHIIYAGMDQNYQNYQSLIKGLKRMKQVNKQFQKVVQYLTQNQIWQGLFRSEQKNISNEKTRASIKINEYHGLCFDSGNYIEVLLSKQEISPSQTKLLMFNFQQQTIINCDISLVLLMRLVNLDVNKSFPQMLNRLFGYQFKIFHIEKLSDFMDCMDFIDRLRDIHKKELRNKGGLIVENNEDGSFKQRYSLSHIQEQEQTGEMQNSSILQDSEKHCDFQLYGENKTSQIFELITPYFFSQKNRTVETIQLYEFRELMRHEKYTKRLSQNYSKLSIINKKQLPVKSIQLKHYSNHFVVVSINVMQEGLYFISVGQKVQESLKKVSYKNPIKYRLCLISSNTKTILQCLILQRSESYPVYLPKQQFEVYISAYESQTDSLIPIQINKKPQFHNSTDQQFINFTFYIQSHHIIARSSQKMSKRQLQLELRLKEEYQSYTSMIVEQFIEFSFLQKEITKFFSQIHQLSQNKIPDHKKQEQNTLNTFGQKNSKDKLQIPKKQYTKISLENSKIESQQSLNFVNNQPNKIQHDLSSESRYLRLSMDNQNAFQIQQWRDDQGSPVKSQENQRQFFTFQDLQIDPSPKLVNILRVHLKALDLFIDCIDTTQIHDKENVDQQNQKQLKIKYSKARVLCDADHNKNTTTLRSDSINLIYLTKDSSIKSIKIQNQATQKVKNQANQCQKEIKFRMFRKEW